MISGKILPRALISIQDSMGTIASDLDDSTVQGSLSNYFRLAEFHAVKLVQVGKAKAVTIYETQISVPLTSPDPFLIQDRGYMSDQDGPFVNWDPKREMVGIIFCGTDPDSNPPGSGWAYSRVLQKDVEFTDCSFTNLGWLYTQFNAWPGNVTGTVYLLHWDHPNDNPNDEQYLLSIEEDLPSGS